MTFEYSPYILPLIAAALVSVIVAVYAWMRRSANGAFALFLMAVAIFEWTVGYSLEITSVDLESKYFWAVIQYIGIAFVPYGLLIFSIVYSDQTKILSRRFIILTALIPSITALLALTTKWHGLIWKEFHIEKQGSFSALGVTHGFWFNWVHFPYSYIILLIGTILLARALWRARGMYRGQIAAMLVAVLTPWIGNVLYLTGNSPIPYLDLTPFAFTVTVAALAWAIFGFHLVDIAPLARDIVVDSMRDGMIVLDVRGNVVDINNAAARMIGVPVANALGKTAGDIFSPWSHLVERFSNVMDAKDEISVGEGEAKRRYEVRLSPLQDQQGKPVGRVIMLRALDEDEIPQPRFAVREPVSRPLDGDLQRTFQISQAESKNKLWDAIGKFFSPSARNDLPVDININPIWARTMERVFTLMLRVVAVVGTLAMLLVLRYVSRLFVFSLTIISVILIFWVIALWRSLPLRLRTTIFLLIIYILAFIEMINFGYSVEAFTYLVAIVVLGVLLEGLRGGLWALAISLLTLGGFGALISLRIYHPLGIDSGSVNPDTLQGAIVSMITYATAASALVASINTLMRSLNGAWQKETQALNLLQQERDLLEQRVEERTHDLADARDIAVRSSIELRKYYSAIEQSGNTIVITDTDGNIEYVNPKFEKTTGYSAAEIKGKNPRILKSGKQSDEYYSLMWKTISGGNVWFGEFLNKRKNGSLYWESAAIAPVLDPNGVITNYVAIKEDVTARRQVEEQLRKLLRAVEQSGNTVIIMDDNGLIEYANPKFTEVTGYSPDEALGKSPISLMNGLGGAPDFSQDEWWKTVNAGQVWHGEFQNRRKDGTVFWESATIAPVHNRDGEVTNFVEIKQDITEQKILQDQLQKQNDYLSILHQITLDLLNRRDLNDLLKVVVERSAILLDAPFSELMLEEDGALVVEAFTDNQQNLKGDRVTREQARLSWQAFDTHQPVLLEDYSVWEYKREIYSSQSIHATADFPVIAGDRCLGVLALGRSKPNYRFTPEQVETGILFARLVALVLDNANLYDSAMKEIAERERMEQALFDQYHYLSALHTTTFELLQSRDVVSLLNKIVTQAVELVGAHYGDIFLSEGDDLVLRAASGSLASNIGNREKKPGSGILGYVWKTMEPFAVDNYSEWEGRNPLYVAQNFHAVTGVPIIGRGEPLGVLEVVRLKGNDARKFTSQEIEMLGQFSTLASLVLDSAQLYDSAQKELVERKRTESLLQESEARFRQIVENASDIIYRTDINGNFTYANPSALNMIGYASEQEVLGKNYLDLTTPEFRHKLKRVYDHQYISKTKSTYYEFPAFTVDGQVAWVGQNVQLIMDGEQIIGFQAVARNITQLRQAQEALSLSRDQALDASRFKSQLLSRVSHELRTPLGGILGYAELLQYKAFGSLTKKQKDAISNIIESTNYLTSIVNDLLDESQIESKSLSLYNEYFNPVELLEKIKSTMFALADKKGLAFNVEISPDLPGELYGDVNRLQQVIINLVGNAIKFTREGEVSVTLKRPAPAQWSIEVLDTGAGILRSEHESIFEPFRQVNNSITRENRGSGLGLAITKQLVEIMGGQIRLESEVGKGSLFTIILPITNAPGE